MSRSHSATTTIWIAVHAVVVASVAALLLFEPIGTRAGAPVGIDLQHAVPLRRMLLAVASTVLLVRLAATGLILMPRSMGAGEAIAVAIWLAVIHFTFAFIGGSNPDTVGVFVWAGAGLFVAGSVINTRSEIGRLRFKRRPENSGRLYTAGLFSWSMHPNYLGDVVWCIGWAMITGRAVALIIPALMTAMFVLVHIPRLDDHLAARYGEQFDRYRRTTKKLIPGVY